MFCGKEINDRVNDFVCNRLPRADERRKTVQCRIDQQRITIMKLEEKYRYGVVLRTWFLPGTRPVSDRASLMLRPPSLGWQERGAFAVQ